MTDHKFPCGSFVVVRSGKVYRITDHRLDDHPDFKGEPGYCARQIRKGVPYGPYRIFPESSLNWPPLPKED